MSLEHVFPHRWWHSDVYSSLIGWHKMLITQEWVTCCQVWCVYEICTRIPFSKQYKYVTNHMHLYVTNYYIFVFTVTLLLLTKCLSFINANNSSNTTYKTLVICHQISTSPRDLFLLCLICTLLVPSWVVHVWLYVLNIICLSLVLLSCFFRIKE